MPAGHFTVLIEVRSMGRLLRCNIRTMFPRTVRPHSEFCSKPHWTCIGSLIVSYFVINGFSISIIACRYNGPIGPVKEPTQVQAFRSDVLPLLSSHYTAFLFSCGDEFCSDVCMEFFFVLCYKLATMLWQGWWQHKQQ